MVYEVVFDQANPFYIYIQWHTCPNCGKHISTSYRNTFIPMKQAMQERRPMARRSFPFVADEYEIRHPIFWCKHCDHTMTITEMKEWEREKRQAQRKARREERANRPKRRY